VQRMREHPVRDDDHRGVCTPHPDPARPRHHVGSDNTS
jgi:hypothetical protein